MVGVKQSAGDLKLFADLMIMSQAEDLIFCAVDALLYSAYALGARGSLILAHPRRSAQAPRIQDP